VSEIHRNGFAPFRFFTPFPHRPSRHLRNSACKICHLSPDVRANSFFNKSILSCSNILGGRFHRLPSIDDSGRLNLQGRSFHSRVFHPKQYGRELSEVIQRLDFSIIFGIELVIKKYLFSEYVWEG